MRPPAPWLTGNLIGIVLALQGPAQAGLLLPVLQLMRPQLEAKLTKVCVEKGSAGNGALAAKLQSPCQQLAKPTSACLVEETDATGHSLGVISELIQGQFGSQSELVVKRCLAKMLGLPADSLNEVPLLELATGFNKTKP
ncbi:hypothetical protein [Cyanobium sp. HWJ4-Hawea]|uniref:hypothetical protein n=1 Tax=Cyanobium sp. HWJ4-Hawea TaxID=2823713 RepID=UPI0020CDEF23|nr:hypothetical protein [Cyanobium sp. HWJ4-Hawea]